jgi:gamma-glutamyltranspeptidase/glutathione hydrolase
MYLDSAGNVIEGLSTFGPGAAGVPGTVAGLHALWSEYGSMPWEALVRTAADMADTGFIVNEFLAKSLARYRDELSAFESTRNVFLPTGSTLTAGDRLIQTDLASTLYTIAAEGPSAFYQGKIAAQIEATMQEYGGLITREDLAAYAPLWREPVSFTFDSLDIYCMSPPSSGGIVIGQILKLLEPYDFSTYTASSPAYIHLFAEAARLAFADRSEHLGDPDYWQIPAGLLGDEYLDRRRELISTESAANSQNILPGSPWTAADSNTTHISICDRSGNMVSLTYTLNSWYGCKLVVEGAGFLLNNEMDDFAIKPDYPNEYGLIGGQANRIEPGKRMLSSMAPTLVLKDKRPFMVLGAAGGSKIISAVAETIINHTRFGMSLSESVRHPRFHHQWLPDHIQLEPGYDVATIQRLIRYGHNIEETEMIADLHAVAIDPLGLMQAAADNRRNGAAGGH